MVFFMVKKNLGIDIGELKLKKKKLNMHADEAFELFKRAYAEKENCFLLESLEAGGPLSRYSFVGFDPIAVITSEDNVLKVREDGGIQEFDSQAPFKELQRFQLLERKAEGFAGGLLGFISFESMKYFEPRLRFTNKKQPFPDFCLGVYIDGVIFDRLRGKVEYFTLKKDRGKEVEKLRRKEVEDKPFDFREKGSNFTKEGFEGIVAEAKEYICSGNIFQIVLSQRFSFEASQNKLRFYEALQKINPSPYMYYLKFNDVEIIGSSPEMLVRAENHVVETYPIAGTRPRGKTASEDKRLKKELLSSEKEKAEHLMLVDLARNDVGRVSDFGSVHVDQYMHVKKFSHVQHIISKVTGKLRRDKSSFDAFASIFPAGTVSGAPKIRAVEIIDELENIQRGPYAGAVGYFGFDGNCDTAITIRTLCSKARDSFLQVGAGIVFDSEPEKEFIETVNKGKALVKAMEEARRQ